MKYILQWFCLAFLQKKNMDNSKTMSVNIFLNTFLYLEIVICSVLVSDILDEIYS